MNTGDPLGKVAAGEPRRITARTWNTFVDAARQVLQGGYGGTADDLTRGALPAITVTVRNDSGADRSRGHVLTLGASITDASPLIDAATTPFEAQRDPVLKGTTPAATDDTFAVLAEPVPDGKLGRAVVCGVAVCDIDVTDAGHEFATAKPSTVASLTSANAGAARIVWRESGTGTKRAIVLLGAGGSGSGGVGVWVRMTTSHGSGLYTGYVVTRDPATGTWTDSAATVYLNTVQVPGSTLSNATGARYLAVRNGTKTYSGSTKDYYDVLGDADGDGTDFGGGLVNRSASEQKFYGPKKLYVGPWTVTSADANTSIALAVDGNTVSITGTLTGSTIPISLNGSSTQSQFAFRDVGGSSAAITGWASGEVCYVHVLSPTGGSVKLYGGDDTAGTDSGVIFDYGAFNCRLTVGGADQLPAVLFSDRLGCGPATNFVACRDLNGANVLYNGINADATSQLFPRFKGGICWALWDGVRNLVEGPLGPANGAGRAGLAVSVSPATWSMSLSAGGAIDEEILTASGGTATYSWSSVSSDTGKATCSDSVAVDTLTDTVAVVPVAAGSCTITTTVVDANGLLGVSVGTITVT